MIAFAASSCDLIVQQRHYVRIQTQKDAITIPTLVVGDYKVDRLYIHLQSPFPMLEYFSNEVALVAYVEDGELKISMLWAFKPCYVNQRGGEHTRRWVYIFWGCSG